MRGLVHELIEEIASFDSRMLRTARALLFQPGELPCAFREGRTQPYVPAVRLYLFVSVVFFVLLGMSNIAILQLEVTATPQKAIVDKSGTVYIVNPAYDATDRDPDIPKLLKIDRGKVDRNGNVFSYGTNAYFFARIGSIHPHVTQAQRKHLYDQAAQIKGSTKARAFVEKYVYGGLRRLAANPAALNGPLTTWLPRALFLLLPLYALLLALMHFRRRKDYYLVDHVVFSLSVHTFTFVALIAAAALAQIVPDESVSWLLLATISIYIFLAMKRFYAQGWLTTAFKFVIVSGIYTIFFLLPAMGAVFLISLGGGSLG